MVSSPGLPPSRFVTTGRQSELESATTAISKFTHSLPPQCSVNADRSSRGDAVAPHTSLTESLHGHIYRHLHTGLKP